MEPRDIIEINGETAFQGMITVLLYGKIPKNLKITLFSKKKAGNSTVLPRVRSEH